MHGYPLVIFLEDSHERHPRRFHTERPQQADLDHHLELRGRSRCLGHRSTFWKELTKGTAVAKAPAAPTQLEVMIQVRLLGSFGVEPARVSLMRILKKNH